jgi:hypothetical protein
MYMYVMYLAYTLQLTLPQLHNLLETHTVRHVIPTRQEAWRLTALSNGGDEVTNAMGVARFNYESDWSCGNSLV